MHVLLEHRRSGLDPGYASMALHQADIMVLTLLGTVTSVETYLACAASKPQNQSSEARTHMAEILDALKPIADIVGDNGVSAAYSDQQFYLNGSYRPGWIVTVNANYRGARLTFSNRAPALQAAADESLKELQTALGIS